MTSRKKIRANRRNAKKSTGPKTPEGKDEVRFNSVHSRLIYFLPRPRLREQKPLQRSLSRLPRPLPPRRRGRVGAGRPPGGHRLAAAPPHRHRNRLAQRGATLRSVRTHSRQPQVLRQGGPGLRLPRKGRQPQARSRRTLPATGPHRARLLPSHGGTEVPSGRAPRRLADRTPARNAPLSASAARR